MLKFFCLWGSTSDSDDENEMNEVPARGPIKGKKKSVNDQQPSTSKGAVELQNDENESANDLPVNEYLMSLIDEEGNIIDIMLSPWNANDPFLICDLLETDVDDGEAVELQLEPNAENLRRSIKLEKKIPKRAGYSGVITYVEGALFHPDMPFTESREKYFSIVRISNGRIIRPRLTSTLYHFNMSNAAERDCVSLIELNVGDTPIPVKGKLRIRIMEWERRSADWLEIKYNCESMPICSVTYIKQRSFCKPVTFDPEAVMDYDINFIYMKYSLLIPFYTKFNNQVYLGPVIKVMAFPLTAPTNSMLAKNYRSNPMYSKITF